ncbi:MAG: hypothetical protein JNM93_14465 [Bacteriovoracaceae bacterium]|nr:hypothetical protein [Bacteriovoracaceae bacterium]
MKSLNILFFLFLVACVPQPQEGGLLGDLNNEDEQNQTETPANVLPQVSLGSDLSITLPTNAINIQASAADQDGSISSFAWEKISGANATLVGSQSDLLQLSNLQEGTYQFRLTVTDNVGDSASDIIQVVVNPAPVVPVNQAPTVNAGIDQEITLPTNTATFSASAQDSDGSIASYTWSKISGPNVTLAGVNTLNLSASNLLEGTYVFRVTVKDNQNASALDDVQIVVKPKPNVAPTIAAIADIKLTLPTNSTTITAVATDSDGSIASYSWNKKTGGAATLANANTSNLNLSALVSGNYEFELTVLDNQGASASVIAKIFVNAAPTVSAGADKEITLPTNTLTLAASASDSDGTISSYLWEKNSGPAATLANTTTSTLNLSSLVEGTYIFKVTVKDNQNAAASDEVQVVVKPKPNTAPVANAGNDQTIQLPISTVSLSGTASDAENQSLTYLWTKKSGPTATISNTNTLATNVTSLVEGTYVFNLKVTDTSGGTHNDDIQVVVQATASTDKPTLTMFHQVCSPSCLNYWVSLPKDYYTATAGTKFPVIMFLHGHGERGDGSNTTANQNLIAAHGPFKYIKAGTWPQNYKFIVVAPQLPTSQNGFDWTDPSKDPDFQNWTEKVITHALATFPKADDTRLYVTGLSMGGEGSTRLMVRYPSRYAAAVIASGRYDLGLDACVAKNQGMWFFHGDQDNGADNNYSQGLAAVTKFNNCHTSSSNHMAGMTTLVGDGHSGTAWGKVYGSFGTQHSGTNIYDWLLLNTKTTKVKPPVIAASVPPTVINGGIEANTPPTISKVHNVFMDNGTTKFVKIDYQDDDDDQIVLKFIQTLPSFAFIEDEDNNSMTLRIEPNANAGYNKRFDIEARDISAAGKENFYIRVRDPSIRLSDNALAGLAGKQTERALGSTAAKYGFYEYVPRDVANTNHALYKKWPVILFLHGMGERSNGGSTPLSRVIAHGPSKLIAAGKHFDAFVFSPQANYSWDNNAVDEFVDHIFSVYGHHIDRTRFYVTGLSMGGGGTFNYAGLRPDRVAAIVPICGVGSDLGYEMANTPIWAFTNKDDGTVGRGSTEGVFRDATNFHSGGLWSQWPYGGGGPSNATSMPFATTAVNARGVSTSTGWTNSWVWTDGFSNSNVGIHKYTIYNASGHDSWTKTYNDSVNSQTIGVYNWMFAQKLVEHDLKITQITFSQIQHHQNEAPQVRFEVKVTGKNAIGGVFAHLNNFGGSSKYNLKMTSIGNDRYELVYNMPSNLSLGKREIYFMAIDNQKNVKVEKRPYAILNPNYATAVGANELNYKVKINFGEASNANDTWNTTMFAPTPGMVYPSLLTEDKRNSKITMLAGTNWSGANNWGGHDVGTTSHDYQAVITRSHWSVYKNTATLYFHGLNPSLKYSFKFFASTKDTTSRPCYFKIGSNEVSLEAKANATNTVSLLNVTPDANGMVEVKIRNHDSANSSSTFHYAHINAIEISPTN